MSEHVGVVRSGPGLEKALAVLREIAAEAGDDMLVANMALASEADRGIRARAQGKPRGAFPFGFP